MSESFNPVQLASVTEWIAPPPAAVWAVVADFAHPERLAPTIVRCDVAGDVRTVYSSRGAVIHERLVESDSTVWRFVYEVLDSGDMPFAGVDCYRATVTLADERGGTVVAWRAEGRVSGDAAPVEAYLLQLYRGAIARIAALVANTP